PPGSPLRADLQVEEEQAVRIRKRQDGHFMERNEVNGRALHMLADNGASPGVLRPADGVRPGVEGDRLRYTGPGETRSGTASPASLRLTSLSAGKIRLNKVDALVAKRGTLRETLLGMSFLNRLNSYEFSGEYLTLRKI